MCRTYIFMTFFVWFSWILLFAFKILCFLLIQFFASAKWNFITFFRRMFVLRSSNTLQFHVISHSILPKSNHKYVLFFPLHIYAATFYVPKVCFIFLLYASDPLLQITNRFVPINNYCTKVDEVLIVNGCNLTEILPRNKSIWMR